MIKAEKYKKNNNFWLSGKNNKKNNFVMYFVTGIHINPYWAQMAGPFPCLNLASESEEDYRVGGYATSRLVLPLDHCQAEILRNYSETSFADRN